ncbi:zinc-dependent alcohol dehydrogenase family protein [Changpingibacter yushuensis]|uniref:zinc-dependent alcohol dehydrogenase family protein n=1 Tax=Changpingibacter yushuensis TaxID=2758440 RepID=UPI0015F4341D|nr:zinc-dependent alcohol dehydrogenase family protein [Changpingibacter yushuensis]
MDLLPMGGMMHAVTMAPDGTIAYGERPIPHAGAGKVLIRVAAVGICGTDLHLRAGDHVSRDHPIVPGHEFAGTIVATGEGVDLRVGTPVAVDPNIPCRKCAQCQRGRSNLCENYAAVGVTMDGAAAQFVAVPEFCCVRLPETMRDPAKLANAALIEPISCAVHGIDTLQPSVGDRALIYGAGTMGLIMTMLLAASGVCELTVVDPNTSRLDGARQAGATVAVSSLADLRKHSSGAPALWDLVVDCSGVPAAISEGIDQVIPGGTFLQFGVSPTSAVIEVSPYRIYRDEIRIVGSMAVHHSFARAAQVLATGLVDPDLIVSDRIPLSEYEYAINLFAQGKTKKVLVIP